MRLTRILALGGLVALPAVSRAQSHIGVVSGFVVDSAGKPIVGVRVNVMGTPVSAATGAQGDFRLDSVIAGPRQIRFRKSGYADLLVATTVKENDISDLDVMLKPGAPRDSSIAPDAPPDLAALSASLRDMTVISPDRIARRDAALSSIVASAVGASARGGEVWSRASAGAPSDRVTTVSTPLMSNTAADMSRTMQDRPVPDARGSGSCNTHWPVMIDGVPLDRAYRLDDIAGRQVGALAVRVPSGGSSLPNAPAGCGVVLVWTRP